ncbi:MAG: nucleotide exchange factor GrpE [Candidatus Bathyarchaeota archaeon]|jgi:molecular chaperone GrpE
MSPESDNKEVNGGKEAKCIKKVADLKASLKEKTQLEETYLNQLKYARADLENLQKHIQRRVDEGVTREKAKLIMQILTVAEEVDLALDEAKKEKNSSLLKGMEMVRKKLWKVLSCEGLCPIEAFRKPFDPHMHESVQEIETCHYPVGMVVQEVRKGYVLNGKVLRPSLVKVACSPDSVKVEKVNES